MSAYFRAVPASQVATLRADPRAAGQWSSPHEVDVDKAWHGLHWLFNGTAWDVRSVAGEAILGGVPLASDDDEGNGDAVLASVA